MSETPEHALIARCQQGDDDAFRELVERHKRFVFAVIARAVRDPSRAEELAQEVFLKVHRGLPYFRGEARLSTWIFRIAANVCAGARSDREVPFDTGEDGRLRREPGGPDRAYTDLELKDRLDKAMNQLAPQYRLIIQGHYLQGLKYEELAATLQLPLGTVKTHLHRAKQQLRRLLEAEAAAHATDVS